MSNQLLRGDYDCVDEVPLHRVRGNQLGILLSIVASVLSQQLWILAVPLIIQLISRSYGVKYNLFVRLFSPLFPVSSRTESRELLRFNNLLAILFLAVTLTAVLFSSMTLAYITLSMLTIAVVLALSGFCFGCFVYFQWKQFWARRRNA
ncbi:DUF4395 domain-containing protein [Paenibacillus qinlingensis]|uniref:FtsH-binding integral membrane protein n=1 Tax=Paenibacillus qinlingensis TaxID=1837343 RepID=A0ABU1NVY8_9BACL|nr:DUF4395 domain-containing protein [Paenibacillus qinlingensis]MDR6551638.1 FtsH-binding integral membrane protein [Paenibacillus qinlingensis]